MRNIIEVGLTKSFIESKVPQELVMSTYLDIPLDIVNDCINNDKLITSIFRDDDTNKSMGFAFNAKGKLKVRDFGGFGFFEDIYGTVAYVLSIKENRDINTSNKSDFMYVLKHIAKTFSGLVYGKETVENSILDLKDVGKVLKSKRAVIEIASRDWNQKDQELWARWGVDIRYLQINKVIPVEQYYINRTINSDPKYFYKYKDPCYAYILGKDRSGVLLIKLYFPLRNRDKEHKFITNCNVLEGLLNLESNYDYILITKSSKDRLAIGNMLVTTPFYGGRDNKLNIGVVNLPSENYEINQNEYNYLLSRIKYGGKLISLLDFDRTGRKGAKYLKETYDIPYLFITRGEFGLTDYNAKDFAELYEVYKRAEIVSFIDETIKYVEYVYNTDAEVYGLSDFDTPY